MRIVIVVGLVLAGLVAAGWLLVPLLLAHVPAVVGFLGVAALLVALVLPKKPSCTGLHCSGCKNH